MKIRGVLVLVIVLSSLILASKAMAGSMGLDGMKLLVRARFSDVQQLSTADLQAWLDDPQRPKPMLLDVRTRAEFDMSHLPGASWVDPSSKASDVTPFLASGRPVVTYCSVGYRSSAMAQKLQRAGVKSVYNLEGSIFQWANENRPLEANGKPATKVHPYDNKFGAMLDPDKRGTPGQ